MIDGYGITLVFSMPLAFLLLHMVLTSGVRNGSLINTGRNKRAGRFGRETIDNRHTLRSHCHAAKQYQSCSTDAKQFLSGVTRGNSGTMNTSFQPSRNL